METEGGAFTVLFRLVVIPMTLFSGTFFPVDRLPGWMRPLAWVSPLWHGTELARAAALDRWVPLAALGHLGYLLPCSRWALAGHAVFTGGCPSPRRFTADGSAPVRRCWLLPAGSYAGRSRALLLRSATASRRTWLAFVSGFFEPVFYLVAHGAGARVAGRHAARARTAAPISYAAFIAPGLLAASAMNGAVFDSTFNVFFKLKYARLYDAMLATPLGPVDIALGEIGWALIRGGLYALGFLTVMAGFGLLVSPWALLALPAALLVAFAFAAIGMAATSYMRSWQDFDLVTLAVLPMFLFSTTFYPLSVYPRWLQIVGRVPAALPRGGADARAHHRRRAGWAMFGHLALLRGDDRARGGGRGAPARRAVAPLITAALDPSGDSASRDSRAGR